MCELMKRERERGARDFLWPVGIAKHVAFRVSGGFKGFNLIRVG
jgi:hypothetical protein